MKKFLLMTLSCLLCIFMLSPALAEGALEAVTGMDQFEGCIAVANDYYAEGDGRTFNHVVLASSEALVLIAASKPDDGQWQADVISTTAVYQHGQMERVLHLWQGFDGFVLQYGEDDEAGTERYTFTYDEETGEYFLSEAYYYTGMAYHNNNLRTDKRGMMFWCSGPENSFVPIGDALWLTDGITLSEFNIAQTPSTMAEINNLNRTANVLAYEGPEWQGGKTADVLAAEANTLAFAAVPLVTQADTILTDDPFGLQRALVNLPAGTEVTGLAQCGEYYAYVEAALEGQTIRGFVPMKDLMTKYDRVLTTGDDLLSADIRWDVINALTGKWFPKDRYDESELLILFTNGGYRTKRALGDDYYDPEGNFRVYDVENGDGSTYEMWLFTEDNNNICYTLRLNEDGTITLTDQEGQSTVMERNEYSSYGNG